MHARDQSSIFSTGGKFRPDYGLLLELHTLTLVASSYALLPEHIDGKNKIGRVYTRVTAAHHWLPKSKLQICFVLHELQLQHTSKFVYILCIAVLL